MITCRGVLNDLITDEECVAALRSFADLCRIGGLLVLEVRDVGPSREQANGQPRTVVQLDGSRQAGVNESTDLGAGWDPYLQKRTS